MKQRILKKLSSQAGESIGETLVALLISALALMMLAGAVTSAMRVVTRSKDAVGNYYAINNVIAARATDAPTIDGAAVTVYTANGLTVSIGDSSANLQPSTTSYPVNLWKNEQLSGVPVIAYTKP